MYNKRWIMSLAWSICKEDNVSMSVALRAAWAIAKAEVVAESHVDDYCGYGKVKINSWKKGKHSRTYIEVRHYTNAWNLKRTTSIGYVDNLTGIFYAA